MPIKELITGGLRDIQAGLFGVPSPGANSSSPQAVQGDTINERGFYAMREGAVFYPGTGNWYLLPSFNTPIYTDWGNAFLRKPNTFRATQPPQIYSLPAAQVAGVGGLVAGQLMSGGPLLVPAPEQGG